MLSSKSYTLPSISIHAAREGGDVKQIKNSGANIISIHAAREGGDYNGKQRNDKL